MQNAEGYRARVVNEAKGEASRFEAILEEYLQAPDVTRRRMFIEMNEKVLGDLDKIIIDESAIAAVRTGAVARGSCPTCP